MNPEEKFPSNMSANLKDSPNQSGQVSSSKVLNDSINTDILTKSLTKVSYPLEEDSIFMKDTSNEENNSQTEQNVSRELVQQHYQSKLNTDVDLTSKPSLSDNNKASTHALDAERPSQSLVEMPTIVVHSGPAPPKRNLTAQASSIVLGKQNSTSSVISNLKKKNSYVRRKKHSNAEKESSDSDSSQEDHSNAEDYDDEEEYKPKKMLKTHHIENSDSEIIVMTSDDDNNSLAKRKPTRVTKKPKVYEDFHTSSPNQTQALTKEVEQTSTVVQQQEPHPTQLKPKQFARKSTAPPLTPFNSTQNILANNQRCVILNNS